MDIKNRPVSFEHKGKPVKLKTTIFGSNPLSGHKKIFFSHVFTMNPKDYTQFFELLYNFFDKKLTIYAQKQMGHYIKNFDGSTFKNHQDLYFDYREKLGYHGDIISHSAGPNQYEADKVVMINPLVPFDQNVAQFMWDVSLKYSKSDLKALMGSSKGWGSAFAFTKNVKQNIELIMDWQKMNINDMYPSRTKVDGIMINSVGDNIRDNVFDYINTGTALRPKFKTFEERMAHGDHASIILHPNEIYSELQTLL